MQENTAHNIYKEAMLKAIEIAEKGRYKVMPNPCVGAVLIKDSKIVAEGYHGEHGIDHAEIVCVKNAKAKNIDVRGATMVVTLEPCNHYAKTPPCSKTLVDLGIAKVIIGLLDPNKEASGGLEYLRSQKVEVFVYPQNSEIGKKCSFLIRDFICWTLYKRPYSILKMGASIDGKVATKEGYSSYITNELSRQKVAELRAQIGEANGVILVGAGTFRFDNPKLNARNVDCAKQPRACIILPELYFLYNSYLFKERPHETIVFTVNSEGTSMMAEDFRKQGIKIYSSAILDTVQTGESGYLLEVFEALYKEENVYYLLCEGGPKVAYFMMHDNLVDEYRQYIAPKIFADKTARSAFEGNTLKNLDDAYEMDLHSCQILGSDVELIYMRKNEI